MILRQLPALYLRGSLANVTMKNLTKAQREHLDQITRLVATDEKMAGHKNEFMYRLGTSIRCDYRDDPSSAEEEFIIAIWRGAVQLFYHRDYTFKCLACNSDSYLSLTNKLIKMDRAYPECPGCHKVQITDPGSTNLEIGQFITTEEYLKIVEDQSLHQPPKTGSPIATTLGESKYTNPQEIIDDPIQRTRFFGEFVWNYFRQSLNENVRKEHRKQPVCITGQADEVLLEMLMSSCRQHEVPYNYYKNINPIDGFFVVDVMSYLTTPEFTLECILLVERGRLHGVEVKIEPTTIKIARNISSPVISAEVIKSEYVRMVNDFVSDQNDNQDMLSLVSDATNGSYTLVQQQWRESMSTQEVVSRDFLDAVRNSLPIGQCQQVFDILTQNSEEYSKFVESEDLDVAAREGVPKVVHIAKFLKVTPRIINQHRIKIGHVMQAKGMIND